MIQRVRSTTIVSVRRNGMAAMAGDGQVSVGQTIMKVKARKVRLLKDGKVIAGFAGAAADAFALFDRFESKMDEYRGNLQRAAVELAKDWRKDRFLRRLDALLAVMNTETSFVISGNGDVIEPDDGILAIGSGGGYALTAARVLMKHTELSAKDIAVEALLAASNICVYTNQEITVETIPATTPQ